ncbi:MAG: hypothetical protein J7J57_01100 [Caldisericaceae bacterium]|nr:hypothetical protein [Caldisericaceae bacterium]
MRKLILILLAAITLASADDDFFVMIVKDTLAYFYDGEDVAPQKFAKRMIVVSTIANRPLRSVVAAFAYDGAK